MNSFITDELPTGNLADADDGVDDGNSDFQKEKNVNSQIEDPDFVVNTQDLEDVENTEEFFEPRHKPKITPIQNAKQKLIRAILTDSDDRDDANRSNRDHDKGDETKDTPRRSLRKRIKR